MKKRLIAIGDIHGEYYKLGERIGKFGFSVKKKKPQQKKK